MMFSPFNIILGNLGGVELQRRTYKLLRDHVSIYRNTSVSIFNMATAIDSTTTVLFGHLKTSSVNWRQRYINVKMMERKKKDWVSMSLQISVGDES